MSWLFPFILTLAFFAFIMYSYRQGENKGYDNGVRVVIGFLNERQKVSDNEDMVAEYTELIKSISLTFLKVRIHSWKELKDDLISDKEEDE